MGCVHNSPSKLKTNSLWTLIISGSLIGKIDSIYLVHDMNIDLPKQGRLNDKYTNVLINHGMERIIAEASRIAERSSTLTDRIICKRNMFRNSEVNLITKTDHYATSFPSPNEVYSNQPSVRKQRSSFFHFEADHSRRLLDLDSQLSSIEYCDVQNFELEIFNNGHVSVIKSCATK